MELSRWIKRNNLCVAEFARRSEISRSAMHKYLYEGAKPGEKAMQRIYNATHGAVSANDFYKLSETTFSSDKEDREFSPRYD